MQGISNFMISNVHRLAVSFLFLSQSEDLVHYKMAN